MSMIEDKANKVAGELENQNVEHKVAFDPFLILAIVNTLLAVINSFMACRANHKDALEVIRSPRIRDRWHLRRIIRKQIANDELEGKVGKELLQGVVTVGQGLTEAELEEMFKEAELKFK